MKRATVGVRELKAGLSGYLRRVRRGEGLVVTDRGEAIARIIPAGVPDGLAQLIREGRITWPSRRLSLSREPPRLRGRGPTAAEMVIEDRG